MKNIFKKNQIIIVALAVMIIVAGYLRYSEKNDANKTNTVDIGNGEVLDYDEHAETKGDNILDGDLVDLEGDVSSDLLDPTAEGEDKAAKETTKVDTETAEAGEKKDVAENEADKDPEDVETFDVSDTGEVVAKDGQNKNTETGEAVLVSTTTAPNYFVTNRLEREQIRSKSKTNYTDIINNANLSADVRDNAANMLLKLTANAEQEDATESLLEAKGFADALVTISDKGKVDVVINAASISEQETAQIEDIVKRETSAESKDIVILPVVAEE
jgi:stage III sporulation protein AH